MAAIQERDQHGEVERRGQEKLDTLIGEQLIHALGRPPGLLRVQVRRLWEASYRVNVFVGETVASAKVAHSYFLQAQADGQILESNPAITRQYGLGA